MRTPLLFLAAVVLLATPVWAMPGAEQGGQPGITQKPAEDRFTTMDTNSDSRVTWEEFEKFMPQMRREAFDTIDQNKDGSISREEWTSFRQNHGMQQGMKKGMGAPAPADSAMPEAPAKPLIQPPSN